MHGRPIRQRNAGVDGLRIIIFGPRSEQIKCLFMSESIVCSPRQWYEGGQASGQFSRIGWYRTTQIHLLAYAEWHF